MAVYGLFVGLNDYPESSGFNKLKFAESDAEAVYAAMLRSPTGLIRENATILTKHHTGENLTRNCILSHLDDLKNQAKSKDTIMFYFAGHGFFSEFGNGKNGSYLALKDVRKNARNRPNPDTALEVDLIRRILWESAASNIILMIDACRADVGRSRGEAPTIKLPTQDIDVTSERGSIIMLACSPGHYAQELDSIKGGKWTHFFCKSIDYYTQEELKQTDEPIPILKVFELAENFLGNHEKKHMLPMQKPAYYAVPDNFSMPLLFPEIQGIPSSKDSPWSNLAQEIEVAAERQKITIESFEPPKPTPLKRSRRLELKYGCKRLYFKLEALQNTGSFKYRGATNAIERLYNTEGVTPVVVAASAGNHALGLAVAAFHRKMECHIFMPENTPLTKSSAVRQYTEHVFLAGIDYDDCQRRALEYCEKHDALFIHPFDDPYVVAGQGTIGLELLEDWKQITNYEEISGEPDYVIIPCGGGGLLAGVGTILNEHWPNSTIIAAEPAHVASLHTALENEQPTVASSEPTIADGVSVKKVGRHTLSVIRNFVDLDNVWKIKEDNISVAMLSLLEDARVLSEGAGAVPLAAVINREADAPGFFKNKTVVCIISGGNLDISNLSGIVNQGLNLNNRRAKFQMMLPDRSGALNDLTQVLADNSVSIIDIKHSRFDRSTALSKAKVVVEIETENAEHASEIEDVLRRNSQFQDVRRIES